MDGQNVLSTGMERRTTFSDLPVELRHMVYEECLALQPAHDVHTGSEYKMISTSGDMVELPRSRYFDTALFYVCRMISEEARAVFYRMHCFTRIRTQLIGPSLREILLGYWPAYSPLSHLTFRSALSSHYEGPIVNVSLTMLPHEKTPLAARTSNSCFVRREDLPLVVATLSWHCMQNEKLGQVDVALRFEAREEAWDMNITESAIRSLLEPWRHSGAAAATTGEFPVAFPNGYLDGLCSDFKQLALTDSTISSVRDAAGACHERARQALTAGKPAHAREYCKIASNIVHYVTDHKSSSTYKDDAEYENRRWLEPLRTFLSTGFVVSKHLRFCTYMMDSYKEPRDESRLIMVAENSSMELDSLESTKGNNIGDKCKPELQRLAGFYLTWTLWDYVHSYPGCVSATVGAQRRMAKLKNLCKRLGTDDSCVRAELEWTAGLDLPVPSWRNGMSWAEYVRRGLWD